jgi:hypothetical protein
MQYALIFFDVQLILAQMMDRGPLPRLSYIRRGSHNETLFPHSGGEERRKKREKL